MKRSFSITALVGPPKVRFCTLKISALVAYYSEAKGGFSITAFVSCGKGSNGALDVTIIRKQHSEIQCTDLITPIGGTAESLERALSIAAPCEDGS